MEQHLLYYPVYAKTKDIVNRCIIPLKFIIGRLHCTTESGCHRLKKKSSDDDDEDDDDNDGCKSGMGRAVENGVLLVLATIVKLMLWWW